jgi:hypothetical protein
LRCIAVVCDAPAKRGKEAGNALRVGAERVAVFPIQEEFFTGDEMQGQERFAEEHYGKSKAALKRIKSKE